MKPSKIIMVMALVCAAPVLAQESPPTSNLSWTPLEFLIGTWEAETQGGSANATSSGIYSFQMELRGHVLARHSNTAGCRGPVDFSCDHGDLLYVYGQAPGQFFKPIYFDNEGHVIQYDVSTPVPNMAVFLSNPLQPGPQFKLSYELKGSIMYGKFQIRPPGQAEFKSYLEWNGRKNP
jgi:hypothetical protein